MSSISSKIAVMKKNERRKRKNEEKERRRREKKQWLQWRIQGRDPFRPPPPPPIFRPNLGPKDQKKIAIRSIILSLTSLLESVYEIRRVARTLVLQSGDTQLMFKIKLCFQPNLGVQ